MEKQYPRQFIEEITSNIAPELILFFKDIKASWCTIYEIEDVVEDALSALEGAMSKDELLPVIKRLQKSKIQKRSRWYKAYLNDLTTLTPDSAAFPLSISNMDTEEIKSAISAELERLEAWKNDTSTHLIDFPGIHQFTAGSVYKSFKTDIVFSAWDYIRNKLDGDINNYFRSYPESLIESPLFSPSSYNMMMQETENFLKEIVFDDNDRELLELSVPKNQFHPPKVMDNTDLKIISSLISRVNNDFYKDKTVVVDLYALAKDITGYRPSPAVIESISERCQKLTDYNHTIQGEQGKISFNFFDNIITKSGKGESPYIIATFGEVLANAIVQQKLVKVSRDSLLTLKNPLSQIIYYALQKERIAFHGQSSMVGRYSYTYFQKIVRFKKRNKQQNLALIKESLEDFINCGVCVKKYSMQRDQFIIEFLPLTPAEAMDIAFDGPEDKPTLLIDTVF